MTRKLRSGLPLFSTRLTATISVALVLLILGAVALLGIGAHSLATDLRQNMGFAILLDEDASAADVAAMKQRFSAAPYVASYAYSSPDDVMARWQEMLGDEENISALMDGVNPFAPEFEVHVKATWANPDSLNALAQKLEMVPAVAEVTLHTRMVEQVNSTVRAVAIGAAAFAALMLIISIVLINNAVRLTVYSRRFLIHTMKLVGATGAFIRRPIVRANAIAGLIAGGASAAITAAALAWARTFDPAIAVAVSWEKAVWVFAGMVFAGFFICYLAATVATNKYLRSSHDKMYR
ncbi:MAG: hypothetical protein HDS92_03100 [Bacteroidales bacterium]|nr:hypothetical protein [Bacteroidales bacterium]